MNDLEHTNKVFKDRMQFTFNALSFSLLTPPCNMYSGMLGRPRFEHFSKFEFENC